jgi:hypothetical protein
MSETEQYTSDDHQKFEKDWWSGCFTTFGEEAKQISYAYRMGLEVVPVYGGHWPVYDLEGKNVVDIGGGPVSMLLKCINRGSCAVVDPCPYPEWVAARYTEAGITVLRIPAEDFMPASSYDEAWIYNCAQHVENPEWIFRRMREYAKVIRVFEWIETPPTLGHPHTLHAADLDEWLGGRGTIENINENGAYGKCYYGQFVI